jgi:hypothetical protein
MVRAAVERADRDDVRFACRHARDEGGGQRCHSGGEGDGLLGALQPGEGAFETVDVGVPQALVDQGCRVLPATAHGQRLVCRPAGIEVGDRVGARQVDRRDVDAEADEVFTSSVNGESVCAHT